MSTKEQERAALQKIRKIVEGLGEDSYIGMAFEGCFDIAEENIRNDFADSWKSRWETSEKKLHRAIEERDTFKRRSEDEEATIENMKKRLLTTEEAGTIKAILTNSEREAEMDEAKYAKDIVENAEETGGEAFRTAVARNRNARKRKEMCGRMIQKILEIMSA